MYVRRLGALEREGGEVDLWRSGRWGLGGHCKVGLRKGKMEECNGDMKLNRRKRDSWLSELEMPK